MARRWPPHVAPEVARRRTAFFAAVSVLIMAGALSPMLDRDPASAPRAVAQARTVPITDTQGCRLRVGPRTLAMPVALAMALTDQAGRDQDAAAPLSTTAGAVARLWPAQAGTATLIGAALRGQAGIALACVARLQPADVQTMTADGLTVRANTMWDAIKRTFGPLPAGGFMPGGVRSGHVPGSAHYEGRAIDFFYRPVTRKTIAHGVVLAQWLVAHAEALQIANVIFDAQIWSADTSQTLQWAPYSYPDGPTTNVTLLHFDHVHVDVQRG